MVSRDIRLDWWLKGFSRKKNDYTDIFSPIVKLTIIQFVFSIVAAKGLLLEQLDVKTTFLHSDLKEEIYMQQPKGSEVKGKEKSVCKLNKSFYGLKQAPRQWYNRFDNFLKNNEYVQCRPLLLLQEGWF